MVRKGVPCHEAMVEGLLEGMNIAPTNGDKVFLVDVIPNRWVLFLVGNSGGKELNLGTYLRSVFATTTSSYFQNVFF